MIALATSKSLIFSLRSSVFQEAPRLPLNRLKTRLPISLGNLLVEPLGLLRFTDLSQQMRAVSENLRVGRFGVECLFVRAVGQSQAALVLQFRGQAKPRRRFIWFGG